LASAPVSLSTTASVFDPVNNRQFVIALGADAKVYVTFRYLATNAWSGGWTSLGSAPSGLTNLTANSTGNQVVVRAQGADGKVYSTTRDDWQNQWSGVWQTSNSPLNPSSNYYGPAPQLGCSLPSPTPTAFEPTQGREYVLARCSDGKVYATYRVVATNVWSDSWTSLGGAASSLSSPTELVDPANNRLWVLAHGADGNVYATFRSGGQWSGIWTSLGANLPS
jgi:hypothetical protein